VTKGISEKFDEHEHDTAPKAYPREILEGTKRTTKMAKVDLAELRTESGTRPILTPDLIERHVRENERAKQPSDAALAPFEDPHSRPTIERGFIDLPPESHHPAPAPPQTAEPPKMIAAASAPVMNIGWIVSAIVVAVVFLVSAAGSVGYVLGRRSVHR
jgi:hypothetical protein